MNHDSITPKLSICCLTYNHASYIRQCIEGFLSQEVAFPFEILINDDCSTDGTADIIKGYVSKYPNVITPIFHEENQYRKGIRGMFQRYLFPKARGEYIALCEGDDYWDDPNKIQKQVDFLDSHPDYSMCFSRAKILLEVNTPVYINCFDIEDRDYDATELFSKWIVPTASVLFRREVNNTLSPDFSKILNNDIYIIEQGAHFGKVRGMSEPMVVYRVQGRGVTYDNNLSRDRVMKYPVHYEYLKESFPLIDQAAINAKLAESYYNRAQIQSNNELKQADIKKAEFYCPGLLKQKRKEQLKERIRHLFRKTLLS